MARGSNANIGETYVSANGYEYTKTNDGWVATHRLRAEAKLGRKLRPNERVYFVDGDKSNTHPDNIEVRTTTNSKQDKLKRKKNQLRRLKEEIKELEAELR